VSAPPDHFSRLGLPRATRIDARTLEAAYLDRSAQCHPDRVATADGPTRTRALLESTALNEAYATLRDPVRRAEYLCRLAGIDVEATASQPGSKLTSEGPSLRPARQPGVAFLTEMMTLRDRLDDLDTDAAREDLLDEIEAECARLRDVALTALEAQRAEDAADMLVRLRYVSRFRDEVAATLDSA